LLSLHLDPTQQGAPEVVIKRCSVYLNGTETLPIDAEFMKLFEETYRELASTGERVLGFAKKTLPLVSHQPSPLHLLGLGPA
jgi:magnesium-transporting ATPase (P-type)